MEMVGFVSMKGGAGIAWTEVDGEISLFDLASKKTDIRGEVGE